MVKQRFSEYISMFEDYMNWSPTLS